MRWIAVGYVALLLCHTVLCWQHSSVDDDDSFSDERKLLDYLREAKRTNWIEAFCGRWDDWCLPNGDSRKPSLTCCKGYTCKCNLWNTNCRCKSRLFGGK